MLRRRNPVSKRSALSLPGFFPPPSASSTRQKSYKNEIIKAIREDDVEALRRFREGGEDLGCSNQFGESILHMACRRGLVNVVKFLLDEVSCD